MIDFVSFRNNHTYIDRNKKGDRKGDRQLIVGYFDCFTRMAAAPRKFSEKIALLNKMEQEGNTAFKTIMGELEKIVSSKPNLYLLIQHKNYY